MSLAKGLNTVLLACVFVYLIDTTQGPFTNSSFKKPSVE